MLTLIVVILVIGGPIQHPENLEDVAVAVIAVKLVPRTIKAEDELPHAPGAGSLESIGGFAGQRILVGQDGGSVPHLAIESRVRVEAALIHDGGGPCGRDRR